MPSKTAQEAVNTGKGQIGRPAPDGLFGYLAAQPIDEQTELCSSWIRRVTGVAVDEKSVQLAAELNNMFKRSPEYLAFVERRREQQRERVRAERREQVAKRSMQERLARDSRGRFLGRNTAA